MKTPYQIVAEHYAANRDYYLAKAKRSNLKKRLFRRDLLRQLKSVPCMDCGVAYPTHVMEFDHVRGVKRFNLAASPWLNAEGILAEASKCEIVCANCHRERTMRRLQGRP